MKGSLHPDNTIGLVLYLNQNVEPTAQKNHSLIFLKFHLGKFSFLKRVT